MRTQIVTDPSMMLKSWLCTKTAKTEYVNRTRMNGKASMTTRASRFSPLSALAMLIVEKQQMAHKAIYATVYRIMPTL